MVFLAPEMLLDSPPDIMYLSPPTMIITTETKPTTMEKMLMTSVRILLSLPASLTPSSQFPLTLKFAPEQLYRIVLAFSARTVAGASNGTASNTNVDKLVIIL